MKNKISMILLHLTLLLGSILLILGSLSFQRDGPTFKDVQQIKNVEISMDGGPYKKITLPYTVENIEHRTPISIRTTIHPLREDCIYIKTVYMPAKIYANKKLVFEFGKDKNYPNFMLDPATEHHMIELYGDGSDLNLQVDYLSPNTRHSAVIHPMMLGSSKEIIMERSRSLGPSLVFSLVPILGGLALIFVSIYIGFIDRKGILFLWLGLFSFLTGIWIFGENNFSGFIFRQNTLLYVLSFIGMYSFIVPLIHFTRLIIDFKNPKPLLYLEYFYVIAAGIGIYLQLFGIVSFSSSMFVFHFILPIALFILAFYTVREFVWFKDSGAKKFILPIGILCFTSILELLNYQLPLTYEFTSMFQFGTLLFLLIMGISAGLYIKDSIHFKDMQKDMEYTQKLLDIQTEEQKKTSILLARNEQILRQQRHDLRHHLVVIQELSEGNQPLQDYLNSLIEQVPKADEHFCENDIVNSVIAHYAGLCAKSHIQFTTKIDMPETNNIIIDSNLCAIVSNLLENAIEACQRIEPEKRYIDLRSIKQYDMLTITMDNSFNGLVHKQGNQFFSIKRDDIGVGTASIQAIAEKLNGQAEFNFDDHVFYSSIFIKI